MKTELKNENGIPVIVITIPISERPSASGKTTVIASSNGNKPTEVQLHGKAVIVGLNAYIAR
jgi:hypothetical protein